MTFDSAAFAIDGALLSSALARRSAYAGTNGAQGIVNRGDLAVTALAVPGIGVQIAPGVGLVVNRYQTVTNETYVVSNPGVHTIPSGSMPAANPSAKSYIVAVVVGDPEFTQTGHPWMGAGDPPAGQELTFQYVRPTLIEVAAGATTVPGAFPALPLARLDIPANTTTITSSMITDLRTLAQPRSDQQLFVSNAPWTNANPVYISTGATYADWGAAQFAPSVKVPSWARRALIVANINGISVGDTSVNIYGYVRATIGAAAGPASGFDIPSSPGAIRMAMQTAGSFDVSGVAGTTQTLKVQGYQNMPASPTANQTLKLMGASQMIFDVRFFED